MQEKIELPLIRDAQRGDEIAQGRIAEAVKPALCAYLYRVTLNYDLAEDLTQETLLEMIKSIDQLRDPKHFFGWLYHIAANKFRNHYRQRKVQQNAERTIVENLAEEFKSRQKEHGAERLVQTELSKAVLAAIGRLEPQDRSVLSLRCFDQLAYFDIAEVLDTTEMNARVLFFRAKQALKKELVRQGLSKGSLLMALGFFGHLTESAGAAAAGSATVAVSPAAMHVPVTTTIVATCGIKGVFLAAGTFVVLSALAVTSGIREANSGDNFNLPPRKEVRSFHYTVQTRNNSPDAPSSLSKGAYEQWYYYPEDIDGPVFMRMQRWSPDQRDKQCSWLQSGEGNYYYHSGDKKIYLQNYRLWSRTLDRILVRRLPTDESKFCDFLDQIEGNTRSMVQKRDRKTGLLAQTEDDRFVNSPNFKSMYEYNGLDGTFFDFNWPETIPIIDHRDAMRKRGWTYFKIEGVLDNEPLSGYGQIPFFYNSSQDHPAWLVINVGSEFKIVDTKDVAMVLDAAGKEIARYAGHRFFKGLLRPWMGMHTIDIIRRDAARQEIPFETIQLSDYSSSGSEDAYYADVQVVCNDRMYTEGVTVEYLIAMKEDVLKKIGIQIFAEDQQTHSATLKFTYLQDISKTPSEMEEPESEVRTLPVLPDNGMRWLIDLADHKLGR